MLDQTRTVASQVLEFKLFPKLPTELRFKVWAIAFLSRAPRVVEFRIRDETVPDSANARRTYLWSSSPPPALVNACHEARKISNELAKKTGQLFFNRIFFNPAIDILYGPNADRSCTLSHRGVLVGLRQALRLDDVRFLARDLEGPPDQTGVVYPRRRPMSLQIDLRRFTHLTEIILVVREENEDIVKNCRQYYQTSQRILSSLRAQRAWRSRRWKELGRPPIDHYDYPSVCKLATLKDGEFTFVETFGDQGQYLPPGPVNAPAVGSA